MVTGNGFGRQVPTAWEGREAEFQARQGSKTLLSPPVNMVLPD